MLYIDCSLMCDIVFCDVENVSCIGCPVDLHINPSTSHVTHNRSTSTTKKPARKQSMTIKIRHKIMDNWWPTMALKQN